ncbi:alpha/beta hydrolase [Actinospica durhamensis]|uniref:Alpha/beta hydrolase n=1 Tax=Actinospica durhamensis TaxID=1508375 RepID=A0A941EQN7_9ACTN|nr:alpha/beta hydrolase [Actinospica durhamensis]MBR7835356.1 alpha/beta hydrolase [Actinospica durhamensis]
MEEHVQLGDVAMHVVQDGVAGAPTLLLIHGLGASTDWWEPVIPRLAETYRVVRVDLLGHGSTTPPAGGDSGAGPSPYEIAAQARLIAAALDRLAIERVAVVVGHSTGGSVATAFAEQSPARTGALALVDTGPSLDADTSDRPLSRLLFAPVPGRLLWRLLSGTIVRKSLSSAFTRPVELPPTLAHSAKAMTHAALAGSAQAAIAYLEQRTIPARLAGLDLPILVIFGTEDKRWRSSSAIPDYRAVPGVHVEPLPGVGHTPMFEDPQATYTLLAAFADTAAAPRH